MDKAVDTRCYSTSNLSRSTLHYVYAAMSGFRELHRRHYAELEKVWESGDGNSGWHNERQYIDVMIAFDEVMGLNFLEGLKPAPWESNIGKANAYRLTHIDSYRHRGTTDVDQILAGGMIGEPPE
ncbi:hypothetical protein IE4803_CH02945 [Rhizobium etli bv. phaseoli str. IE4803]|uniref:Uncharacterized protein n=1 Tax=Rhizobium etli bv. mimosae str. IE4771 TaxID=1432050 RepID=A0A060I7Z8_RHIET|nr:hypothetical protein [Rhizobium sp. IE4771]AIC28070.1 hypothetical protein IE4771_CH02976 [Rhizobium sp. IE4771]AJC80129.1 hypothetical protein IE4803_CH02945 [Rhizobium etli bv. phaseoli str. IE4803]